MHADHPVLPRLCPEWKSCLSGMCAPRKQGPRRRIHSLAVHPAQPHLAATGASDGGLAIWDLRFERGSQPQQAALQQPGAGAVLQARCTACHRCRPVFIWTRASTWAISSPLTAASGTVMLTACAKVWSVCMCATRLP